MRLFIAIDLGAAARAAIHRRQRRLAAAPSVDASALRFVREEHLHLTLVFLGGVDDGRVGEVKAALEPPVDDPPFVLGFGGIGVFPPRGAPRVLWLDVVEGREATIRLQASLAARLEAIGIPGEDRPFTPHVTLARWRKDGPRRRPVLPPEGGGLPDVRVEAATLFESRLSDAGPAYTALVRTPLACRSAS